jgi:hypothetical protein
MEDIRAEPSSPRIPSHGIAANIKRVAILLVFFSVFARHSVGLESCDERIGYVML